MQRHPDLTLAQLAVVLSTLGLMAASALVTITLIRFAVLAILRAVSHA